jgi:hypothetical protein
MEIRTLSNAIKGELDTREVIGKNNSYLMPIEPEMICLNQMTDLQLTQLRDLTKFDLMRMDKRLDMMLSRNAFPLITIHDEFKAHPNNMNLVRYHYKEIMAEIAESPAFTRVLGSLQACGSFDKLSYELPALIRESEYALS